MGLTRRYLGGVARTWPRSLRYRHRLCRYTGAMLRSEHLDVRIAPEERHRWHKAATNAGLSTSEWLRRLAADAIGLKLYRQTKPRHTQSHLCARCTRIGAVCCDACRAEA